MIDGPMSRYRELVRSGEIHDDPAQRVAVEKLQLLHMRLGDYNPRKKKKVSLGWLGFGRGEEADKPLTGQYIFGAVGRGKSMLMDLFFGSAPVEAKRRVHFHAFMQEVHAGINAAREAGVEDPIRPVADRIAEQAILLCFDEFQVTDITDAMILGRLFEALFAHGVVVVATSNRPPDDLYKDGLNRQLFLPFIQMLHDRVDLIELDTPIDYRQGDEDPGLAWFTPLGPVASAGIESAWRRETNGEPTAPVDLEVQGRSVRIERATGEIGRSSFKALCGSPLGPADYLAIADRFATFFLDAVPRLSRAQNNEAKRFVTLIDTFYEAKMRLYCSAAASPEELYTEGEGAFEFERTSSRLAEMQSAEWLGAVG